MSEAAHPTSPLGTSDSSLLAALLGAWARNTTVMLNLLHALPEGGLEARAMADSPTVAQQFSHIHHERLVSVFEEAPEFARPVPELEWAVVRDRAELAAMLAESAEAVREAVRGRILAARELDLNFGHPALLLEMLLWHEGYHHGQIKLALKLSGLPLPDEVAGPLTWDVWRSRRKEAHP